MNLNSEVKPTKHMFVTVTNIFYSFIFLLHYKMLNSVDVSFLWSKVSLTIEEVGWGFFSVGMHYRQFLQ